MKLLALLLCGIAGFLTARDQPWLMDVSPPGFTYISADTALVTLDGVCSVAGTTATCWKPDGAPDPDLSARITSRNKPAPPTQNPLGPELGKYRLVIGHRPIRDGIGVAHVVLGPESAPAWVRTANTDQEFAGWVYDDGKKAKIEVTVAAPVPVGSFRVKLGSHDTFQVGDYTVKLVRYGEPKLDWPGGLVAASIDPRSSWVEQDFSITPDPTRSGLEFNPVFVDRGGSPMPCATVNDPWQVGVEFPVGKVPVAFGLGIDGGYWSAQPKRRAEAVLLKPTYTRNIHFANVALNPNPGG